MRCFAVCVAAALVSGASASTASHAGDDHAAMDVTPVNVCNSGVMQSPIDLHTCMTDIEVDGHKESFNIPDELYPLALKYGTSQIKVEKVCTDHGCLLKVAPVQSAVAASNTFQAQGDHHHRVYALEHCDLRMPSEHTIDGHEFPLEVQCHHVMEEHTGKHTGKTRKGILSILFMTGTAEARENADGDSIPAKESSSDFVAEFEDKLPTWDEKTKKSTSRLVPGGFSSVIGSSSKKRYHSYAGSQTTGHCTEDVDWYVMYDPAGISAAQLEKLKGNMTDHPKGWMTPRPIQELYGREPQGCPVHHADPNSAPAAALSTLTLIALSLSFALA
jgi:carbonic anhydrase